MYGSASPPPPPPTHTHTATLLLSQGLLSFLLSSQPEALALRSLVTFVIVPMLNPDGVFLGNYRTDAGGGGGGMGGWGAEEVIQGGGGVGLAAVIPQQQQKAPKKRSTPKTGFNQQLNH